MILAFCVAYHLHKDILANRKTTFSVDAFLVCIILGFQCNRNEIMRFCF